MESAVDTPHDLTLPPHSIRAEQALLGALLYGRDDVNNDIVPDLQPEHFYDLRHAQVFAAIATLVTDNTPVNALRVAEVLERRQQIANINYTYLSELIGYSASPEEAYHYMDVVVDKHRMRGLVEGGQRIQAMGQSQSLSAEEATYEAQKVIERLANPEVSDIATPADLMDGTYTAIREACDGTANTGVIATGWKDVDDVLTGLRPGQLVLVAARPGLGKSVFATDIARHTSVRNRRHTLFCSLEMSRDEIMQRVMAAEATVGMTHMQQGTMTDELWARLDHHRERVETAPLYIDDSSGISIAHIQATARKLRQQGRLDLIVVDYIQLMSTGGRVESRQVEVSDFSRSLKLLAKELGVPVLGLAQLNRNSEQRSDRRPMVSDLRESGSLEQDADVVILLHREDAYEQETDRPGEADVIIAKHRNGTTATVTLTFQGTYARFGSMAR